MFGQIIFNQIDTEGATGEYGGRQFTVKAEEQYEDETTAYGIVDGQFNNEERLYIYTQWEMQQSPSYEMSINIMDHQGYWLHTYNFYKDTNEVLVSMNDEPDQIMDKFLIDNNCTETEFKDKCRDYAKQN